jgi:hypothetical protein
MEVVTLERPQEYQQALEELKHSFHKAVELVQRLKEIGTKHGLSNEQIRKDIELALANVVKPRTLRTLLEAFLPNCE